MLGYKLLQVFSQIPEWVTFGTIRSSVYLPFYPQTIQPYLIEPIDALQNKDLELAIERAEPDCILNCIGVVKQAGAANLQSQAMEVNAYFPKRLAQTAWNDTTQPGICR